MYVCFTPSLAARWRSHAFIVLVLATAMVLGGFSATESAVAAPTAPTSPNQAPEEPIPDPKKDSGPGPVDAGLAQSAKRLAGLSVLEEAITANSESYGGWTTTGDASVAVFQVSGRSAVESVSAAIKSLEADGATVKVSQVSNSLKRLNELMAAFPKSASYLKVAKSVTRFGVDMADNKLEIGVEEPSAAVLAVFAEEFGTSVEIVQAGRAEEYYGRHNDTPAFYSGDWITQPNGGACSSGFTITNAYGTKYALSAGHCFALGSEVTANAPRSVVGGPTYFGTTNFRREGNGNLDNELIGGVSYGGRMWIGGWDTQNNIGVHASYNSCTGCQVFANGARTGQTVGTLVGGEFCTTYLNGGVNDCGLQRIEGNTKPCTFGDSGGPVFAYDGSGGVIAVGIIQGGSSNLPDCYYTKMPLILSYWQATITTSS